MHINIFTVEEENLICCFDITDKANLIVSIEAAIPHLEETELITLAINCLRKLSAMTEADYLLITLCPTFGIVEKED